MKAFEGIRVLDLTHVLAGPFCTYQLGVMGADVIKIEPPSMPDFMREEGTSPAMAAEGRNTNFICQNGNKRSLCLDLSTERGAEIALKLAETTDVLVENYRFGAMARHGLGYEDVCKVNPKIIYCSMTGYGHTGPKAAEPAYDFVIQAFSGLMAATGTPETNPIRVGPAVLDYGTGAQAAFAIAAALFQRTHTGEGQKIDVAMADAALMLMSTHVMDAQTLTQSEPPFGNINPTKAGYSLYETSNGLLATGAATEAQYCRMWRTIGRDDIADQLEGLSRKDLIPLTEKHKQLLDEIFATADADHWDELLNGAGVPAARVRRVDEVIDHPQIRSRGVLQEGAVVPETAQKLRVPVAAFGYAHGGPEHHSPAPRLGEHSREILAEAGISAREIDALHRDGVIHALSDSPRVASM